jgi:hypothetical protein
MFPRVQGMANALLVTAMTMKIFFFSTLGHHYAGGPNNHQEYLRFFIVHLSSLTRFKAAGTQGTWGFQQGRWDRTQKEQIDMNHT